MNALTPTPHWNTDSIGIDADGKWFISAGRANHGDVPIVLRKSLRASGNTGTSILARGADEIARLQLLDRDLAKEKLRAALKSIKLVESATVKLLNGTNRTRYFNTLGHQLDRSTPEDLVETLRILGGFILRQKETSNGGISSEVMDVYTRAAYTLSYWIELLYGVDTKVNLARFESFRLNDFKKLDLVFENKTKLAAEKSAHMAPVPYTLDLPEGDRRKLAQVKDKDPALEIYCAWLLKPANGRPSHSRIADMMEIDADEVRKNFRAAEKLLKNIERENASSPEAAPDPTLEDFGYFELQPDKSLGHVRYRVHGTRIIVSENSYFWLVYVRDHPRGTYADAARDMGAGLSKVNTELQAINVLLKDIFATLKLEDQIPLLRYKGSYRYFRKEEERTNIPGNSPSDRLAKKLEKAREIIATERALLSDSKPVREIFEIAVKHLTPGSIKILSMLYMRKKPLTTSEAAREMNLKRDAAQTKVSRQRILLMKHVDPELRKKIIAWRAKTHP